MTRSLPRNAHRLARPALPGWLVLRAWLVLVLLAPALGLGGWARPAAAEPERVAEPGLHAGPMAHGDPADQAPELEGVPEPSLRGESKDATDCEDDLSERSPIDALATALAFDLATERGRLRFAHALRGGPGSSHFGPLHNRGPPLA